MSYDSSYTRAYSPKPILSDSDLPQHPIHSKKTEYTHKYSNVNAGKEQMQDMEYKTPDKQMLQQNKELRKLNIKINDMKLSNDKNRERQRLEEQERTAKINHQNEKNLSPNNQSHDGTRSRSPQRENTEYGSRYLDTNISAMNEQTMLRRKARMLENEKSASANGQANSVPQQQPNLAHTEYEEEYVTKAAQQHDESDPRSKEKAQWATRLQYEREHSPGRNDTEYGERYNHILSAEEEQERLKRQAVQIETLSDDIVKIQSNIEASRSRAAAHPAEATHSHKTRAQPISEYTEEYMKNAKYGPKKFEIYHAPASDAILSKEPALRISRSKSPGRENTEYGTQYLKHQAKVFAPAPATEALPPAEAQAVNEDLSKMQRKAIIFSNQMKNQIADKWNASREEHARAQRENAHLQGSTEYGDRYTPKSLTEDKGITQIYSSNYENERNEAVEVARPYSPSRKDTEYGEEYSTEV